MSELKQLVAELTSYGYDLRPVREAAESVSSMITGGELGTAQAVLRASGKILNVGSVIGVLESVPSSGRYPVLVDALELNFHHPLARISLFRVPNSHSPDDAGPIAVFLAETSFFHTEMTKEKFDARMNALNAIGYAFSKTLSSRDAILSTNPWYEALSKGVASPRKFDRP